METKSTRPRRKRSPRPTKTGKRSPEGSKARKRLWQDPAYREHMIAARRRSDEERRKYPQRYSRLGVPDGMRKWEAVKAWAAARVHADKLMRGFEAMGAVPAVVVPGTDEEKAKAALHEACVLALSPMDRRTKLSAAKTVLEFTMARPTHKQERAMLTPEAWLRHVGALK